MKYLFIEILFILLLVSACSTDEEAIKLDDTYSFEYVQIKTEISAEGKMHNEGLDYIKNIMILENECFQSDEIHDFSLDYALQFTGNDLDKREFFVQNSNTIFMSDFEDQLGYLNNSGFNEYDKGKLIEILNILNTNTDIEEIQLTIDLLGKIEIELNDNSTNVSAIVAAGIAKASLIYWYNNLMEWHLEINPCSFDEQGPASELTPRTDLDKEGTDWLGGAINQIAEGDFWSGLTTSIATLGNPFTTVTGALWGSAASGLQYYVNNPCP